MHIEKNLPTSHTHAKVNVFVPALFFCAWNNVCAGEQWGNQFKFVGTDLWTRELIGTYRKKQVGINLENLYQDEWLQALAISINLDSNVARQGPENQPFCFTYLPTHARMPADASDVGFPDSRCGGAIRIAALLCRWQTAGSGSFPRLEAAAARFFPFTWGFAPVQPSCCMLVTKSSPKRTGPGGMLECSSFDGLQHFGCDRIASWSCTAAGCCANK